MRFYTVDTIVRNILLRKQYPLHYYLQALVYAKDALRQLHLDDLKWINTELLDVVTPGNYVNLPCDYVDKTKVGIRVGQQVKPLVEQDSLNRLHAYNDQGDISTYNNINQDLPDNTIFYTYPYGLYWGVTVINDYGEDLGRLYGWGAGAQWDTYKVLPERNQIQLNESINVDKIVLEYISDGMCADAASQVDVYAQDAIEAYVFWQFKLNNRTVNLGETQMAEMEYLKQRKILRARKNTLNISDLKRIVQANTYLSPKY